ncbi:MAG: Hsp70 family protein [Synechococcaceae cyanobacterium SM2_3_1]|nr:Hsp70 family protein [Synechococcaceae cyanobacterium SM2_3_1]
MPIAAGIDLGTTNSVVAVVQEAQAVVLPDEDGNLLLPSCVGLNQNGKLLVGRDALRQYAAAPERTIRSIKRQMGSPQRTRLGDQEYLPQEISGMILRALKQQAEAVLEQEVQQAVITVPAYFTDAQRQATKEAGEIAGLEVLQILSEPTAAALAYDIRSEETERVLVYDLGGGTFDVSIVELTGEVTEVLASHGNNRLGGDDFDRELQTHLVRLFQASQGVELPEDPIKRARLLRSAEQAKINLSEHVYTQVREPFLASKGKKALHLEAEIAREEFEDLIRTYLEETLAAIDRALEDAQLEASDLNQVILVGGSTRIPLVRQLVQEHLNQAPYDNIQPDLCVALGAALQAGVLSGAPVESILVDVIPHSLGISAVMDTPTGPVPDMFSMIIPRNTVVPVSRAEVYYTTVPNQREVEIKVYQGENLRASENVPLGDFFVDNLPPRPAAGVAVEVHFDFDINGILTVTATEKGNNQQGSLVINDATTQRLSSQELIQSRSQLDTLFSSGVDVDDLDLESVDPGLVLEQAEQTLEQLQQTDPKRAAALQTLMQQAETAISKRDERRFLSHIDQIRTSLMEMEPSTLDTVAEREE